LTIPSIGAIKILEEKSIDFEEFKPVVMHNEFKSPYSQKSKDSVDHKGSGGFVSFC